MKKVMALAYRGLLTSTVAITSAAFIYSGGRLWLQHFEILSGSDRHNHLPILALLVVGLMVRRLWKANTPWNCSPEFSVTDAVALLIASALLKGAISLSSPWIANIAFVVWLTSLVRITMGRPAFRLVRGPLALLWLTVPLPMQLDHQLAGWMQSRSANVASGIADLFGYLHLQTGNVISIRDSQLFVEEACSGLGSMYTIVATCIFYCVCNRRNVIHCIGIIAAALPVILLANSFRIFTIVAVNSTGQLDVATGTLHTILGLAAILGAMIPLLAIDKLLAVILAPVQSSSNIWVSNWNQLVANAPTPNTTQIDDIEEEDDAEPMPIHNDILPTSIQQALRWLKSPATATCLVAMIILQIQASDAARTTAPSTPSPPHATPLHDFTQTIKSSLLPAQILRFQQQKFQAVPVDGIRSLEWIYSDNNTELVALTLQHPFIGWHPLEECYTSRGWTIIGHEKLGLNSDAAPSQSEQKSMVAEATRSQAKRRPRVRLMMTSNTGEYAMLVYSILRSDGQPLLPDLQQRFSNRTQTGGRGSSRTTQIQALTVSYSQLSPQQRQDTEQLFATLYDKAQHAIVSQPHQ